MNIIVCLKRVPDTTAKLKPGSLGTSIDPQGVEYIINPYDEFAIEEALQIRDKQGGEVIGVLGGFPTNFSPRAFRLATDAGVRGVVLPCRD